MHLCWPNVTKFQSNLHVDENLENVGKNKIINQFRMIVNSHGYRFYVYQNKTLKTTAGLKPKIFFVSSLCKHKKI